MREKQIEFITDLLIDFDEMGFAPTTSCPNPEAYAIEWRQKITDALESYRKQSEGEWEVCSDEYEICASEFVCSNCKESFVSSELTDKQFFKMMKFCPNCGAKMKGGEGK